MKILFLEASSGQVVGGSLTGMLELIGDPADLERTAWSTIGTEVRAGADGYLSQTSVLWGPSGHAFSVSHQSVAIFG